MNDNYIASGGGVSGGGGGGGGGNHPDGVGNDNGPALNSSTPSAAQVHRTSNYSSATPPIAPPNVPAPPHATLPMRPSLHPSTLSRYASMPHNPQGQPPHMFGYAIHTHFSPPPPPHDQFLISPF